jgi:hypothetical protein
MIKLTHNFRITKAGAVKNSEPKLKGLRLNKLPSKHDRKLRSAWKRIAAAKIPLPRKEAIHDG